MAYCCSQCSFTAQFESALTMHQQLHHHHQSGFRSGNPDDLSSQSQCTSKAMKELSPFCSSAVEVTKEPHKEIFSCHLCAFDADRITVLDRHLLNDHKIELESLLKLVMAKTKDGLAEANHAQIYGIRQPYYRPPDDIIENGEFIIETVTPKIKILKHSAVNTDLKFTDIPDFDDCKDISRELEKIFEEPLEKNDKDTLFSKMQSLNKYMCKFVDSSNTLKRVLTKEFVQKKNMDRNNEPYFDVGLGDPDTPRVWERAHSERLERHRSKNDTRSDKLKHSSDSFYF